MQIDKLTTTAEERKVMLAELNAKLAEWQAEHDADNAQSAHLKANIEVQQRSHQAGELAKRLSELCGVTFSFEDNNKWHHKFEKLLEQENQKL
jgi:hypothetical protein